MSCKVSTIVVVCLCVLGLNQLLWGQNAVQSHRIRGYLDPHTGIFQVLPNPAADTGAPPPPAATFGGKFEFSFTITVDATIAATAKIECLASAMVEDNLSGGLNLITEEAAVLATRSGTSASCTVNIPYSWNLVTGSTDKVTLGYTITAPAEAAASASLPARISSVENFATIAVPANGSTTKETVTATF